MAISFMPHDDELGRCHLLPCSHLCTASRAPLVCPSCAAVQQGFRRLQRLCNMSLAEMNAAFKFERGQVWRLGVADEPFDIYIQEAYVEMLPLIKSHVALGQQPTMTTRCMVRGTPGIGKTRFAWARIAKYIMMIKKGALAGMILKLDEFGGHRITVSQRGVGSKGLTPNNSVWVYDLGAAFPEAGLTDKAVHADISLSLDGAHLNGITKSGSHHMLHMPLVSVEEAKAIAKATLPELPDGFEKSLRLVGGTLREPLSMSFDELEKLVDQRIQQMSTEKLVHVLHVARGAEVLDTPSRRQVSPHTLVVADVPCWPTEEDRGQGVPRSRRFYEYRVSWDALVSVLLCTLTRSVQVHFCSAEVQERVMKKILEDKTPSFGEYISRHLQDADAGVNFETYGQWSMRHFDKCFHFGTRRDGLAILCPMIRLYPGWPQPASSEWVFFNTGKRQPVKYTWHRTMESSLYTVFQQDRGEGLEKCVFVPYSQVEAVMDLFLWQRGDCYLIQFTKSMTHRPCAERMLELIRSMNDVSPAALNPADIGIPDDWVIPNLVFAVPSQTVGSFKFQPFQCTTSMLTGDQRKELVATLTAKVKQFKIGVPLTTAAGVPAESKAEYDAAVSPTVLVPLDGIVAELDKYSGADLGNEARSKVHNNVRKLFQRLFNVGPGRSNQLLQWLSTAEGIDAVASASPGGDVSDGDTEMKGQEGEAEVDPLQRFLTEHPAVSFLDSFSDKHATWSIGMRALTARTPVQSGCKRARTR